MHPVVVYPLNNSAMKHVNFVFVFDDLGHNIGAIYAVLKSLFQILKTEIRFFEKSVLLDRQLQFPVYRNKTSFCLVSAHKEIFDAWEEWNFWEKGHEKGVCAGIGGAGK